MKRTRTWIALALALCLALSLSACSPKQAAKDFVVKVVTVLGFRDENAGDDEEAAKVMATSGGEVTFPETMDPTSGKLVTQVEGDTLYVAFNGIQNRNTEYFVPAGDSITVTGYDLLRKDFIRVRAEGYTAICLQHEIDHLSGILFYDRINKDDPWKEDPQAEVIG